jgi:GrpB-like predicted nucleotidyltransferase (UPF0157 family)
LAPRSARRRAVREAPPATADDEARRATSPKGGAAGERVHFVEEARVRDAVAAAFDGHAEALRGLLPGADIQHVGSTAVPGSLTKGDLDIQVRVEEDAFDAAEVLLAARFERNPGSVRTPAFASFKDDSARPPLGVQLTTKGSEFDFFVRARDRFLADPALVARYNAIKRAFDGRSMAAYREAKAELFEELLGRWQE